MTSIKETFGRAALIATATNYRSVAEALMELVDNPIDYRRGRRLKIDIDVDRSNDLVRVTDSGGEGMDDEGLRDWIRWGEGHEHAAPDIGLYHVGGKSAAIYLADDLEIVCRKADTKTTWRFRDPEWGSRTTPLEGSIESLRRAPLAVVKNQLNVNQGFVQVTLRNLKSHRYEIGILKQRLADAYRGLILDDKCEIRVNGELVAPVEMPWSSSIPKVEFGPIQLASDLRVRGHVGAIDRDRLPSIRGFRFPHGIRTEYNGRKITDGEEFGHNLSGRGALMRLYGEVAISGGALRPNQLKNGWPLDHDAWQEVSVEMYDQMASTVAKLYEIADAKPVSRQERKRANSARRRAEAALRRLEAIEKLSGSGTIPSIVRPAGRKTPTPNDDSGGNSTSPSRNPEASERTPRTPPPRNPVGRLLRRVGGMPQVRLDALGDKTPRTQWRDDDTDRIIVVNTDYPLYSSLGAMEEYIFESILLHVLDDDQNVSLSESREIFDQLIWLDHSSDEPNLESGS